MHDDTIRRAHGPYETDSGGWKLVLVRQSGRRSTQTCATRAEAEGILESLRIKATGSRAIGDAVTEYLAACTERGLAPQSVERVRYHLASILDLEHNGHRPLTWLRTRGAELYEAERARDRRAVDTHRNALNEAKRFGAWCAKRRLGPDPFAAVEPVGQRRAGRDKEQLRRDEARILTDYCLAQCTPTVRPEPVAVLAAWLLGTRATELVVRDVRDLDDDGSLLVIPRGKTKHAARDIEIPDVLRPLLLALAAGRGGTEPLFLATDAPTARRKLGARRATRHWLYYHCDLVCHAAGVPSVTPHGLRRSHISVARGAGTAAHVVAAQVGHGSVQVQERSYADRGAVEQGQRERVLRLIQGGRR